MRSIKIDEIVSLGYNCEVSFRIKDYFGGVSSYPYTWAYWWDRDLFIKSISNLDDILTGEVTFLPRSRMFKCEKFNINFHSSKNKKNLIINGNPVEENIKKEISNLKSKIDYLSNKFKDLLESKKNSLFVIKVKHDDNHNNVKFVQELYATLLKQYKSKTFILLVVFEEKCLTEELVQLESDHLKIRSVQFFAKDSETDTDGDLIGWSNIFKEFRLKYTLMFGLNFENKLKNILKDIKLFILKVKKSIID